MRKLLPIIALALALPGVARAGLVTMTARDVPLGPRALAAATVPPRFNMLGVHWRGSGAVEFRVRSTAGRWSAWRAVDDDSGPDVRSPEGGAGWRLGGLDWVGASDRVRFRTLGSVSRVRAFYLWSRTTKAPIRRLALAGAPAIVPRSAWRADESITRETPRYAPALRLAVVHHTAGTNAYTPAQAAAIVRGIEIYHVKGNGWNDIGYNFLVDRFGTVYEGRAGGIERNVVGAHALGFNNGTVGVSLIGNFERVPPPAVMTSALTRLLAWRLDVAHVDPLSRVVYTSAGNPTFRAGKVVTLPAIVGHRDTGPTECPGSRAYALLPALRTRVAATGLPKLYSPTVSGVLGGAVRFQARLSAPRTWTITITDRAGVAVAHGRGTGSTVDWSWLSTGAAKAPYRWTIASGTSVRPATGTLGTAPAPAPIVLPAPTPTPPPPVTPTPRISTPAPVAPRPAAPVAPPAPTAPLLSALSAAPAVVNPGGDGSAGYVTVDFTLAAAAAVIARLTGGPVPITIFSTTVPAGASTFSWNLGAVPDGRYLLEVTATAAGRTPATLSVPLAVDRSLSGYAVTPAVFSPNGDGVNETAVVGFSLTRSLPVQVLLQQGGIGVATIFAGQLGPGPQSLAWNGTSNGVRVADGTYDVVTLVGTPPAAASFSVPLTVDTTAPVLTLLDAATLKFQLSEPATVTAVVNGQTVSGPGAAGVFALPLPAGPVTSLSVQAVDAAGNTSAPVTFP